MPVGHALLSPLPFDFSQLQDGSYTTSLLDQCCEKEQEAAIVKGKPIEEMQQIYPLSSDYYCPYSQSTAKGMQSLEDQQPLHPQLQQQPPKSNCTMLDVYFSSCFPAPTQSVQDKKIESSTKSGKETGNQFCLSSSLELLNNFASGVKKLNMNLNLISNVNKETSTGTRKKLSAEEILRVAGARYVQFSDQSYVDHSTLMHPFGYALCGLSEEETRDVELAHLLLAVAEKVGCQQYERASRLLTGCELVALERSNSLQRIVYYFAEALQERIDKATGRFTPKEAEKNTACLEILQGLNTNLTTLSIHQKIPFSPVWQLTAIQTLLENVGSARKVHLIDFEIRSGVQWSSLMQALEDRKERKLEHLKITAVGIKGNPKVEETGKRLESFAKSINLPFMFKAVYVPSLDDIKKEQFEIEADESVVVVCNLILRTMVSRPESLDNLMAVIRSLNPRIMLVVEVEANHNSPNFFNRFLEALFFYSAFFDCMETCMDQDLETRTTVELLFYHGIQNIVATEGAERITRNVKMDAWRAFFSRFKMVEIEISETSLYQANLVLKQFSCWSSCTLDKSDKCLLIGWKGTPLHSLSAWKFSRDRIGRSFAKYSF